MLPPDPVYAAYLKVAHGTATKYAIELSRTPPLAHKLYLVGPFWGYRSTLLDEMQIYPCWWRHQELLAFFLRINSSINQKLTMKLQNIYCKFRECNWIRSAKSAWSITETWYGMSCESCQCPVSWLRLSLKLWKDTTWLTQTSFEVYKMASWKELRRGLFQLWNVGCLYWVA